jgi:hypothetical protein
MAFKMIEKRIIFSNLFYFQQFRLPAVLSPGELVRQSPLWKFQAAAETGTAESIMISDGSRGSNANKRSGFQPHLLRQA